MDISRPESRQPIPPHAKKVFDGVLFEIYQWEQELFDGSRAIFEKGRRKDDTVSVVAVTQEGKILMIEDEQPSRGTVTTVPGGRVDAGETPHEAAVRELLEETGYASDDWKLLWARQPVMKLDWGVYCFLARGCRKAGDIKPDAGERIVLRELTFDQFIAEAKKLEFHEIGIALYLLRALAEPGKIDEVRKLFLGK